MKKVKKKIVNKGEYIMRAIPYLTPKQSTVMQMRYVEGRSYQQIADTLEIYEDTARKIMWRAKKVIHNAIEEGIEPEEIKNNLKRPLTSAEKELRRIRKVRLRVQKEI